MSVLIVESNEDLARLWKQHIEHSGCQVSVARSQHVATELLRNHDFSVIVLDQMLEDGGSLAVADYAAFRRPKAQVVFVTNDKVFSDGSAFQHVPNLRTQIGRETPAADLSAMVHHFAGVH